MRSESRHSAFRVALLHLRNTGLISQTDWTSRAMEAVVSTRPEGIRERRPDLRALLSSRTISVPAAKAGDTHDRSINKN